MKKNQTQMQTIPLPKKSEYAEICDQIGLIHDQLRSELQSHQSFYEILELDNGHLWQPDQVPKVIEDKLITDLSVELYRQLLALRIKRKEISLKYT